MGGRYGAGCRIDRHTPMWALAALLGAAGGPVMAQGGEGTASKQRMVLEEVTVTARRVEQSLQDTPVSVVAFTTRELDQLGISEVNDISRFTPNLEIRKAAGSMENLTMGMRGMSISTIDQSVDPPIGIYVDGIYLARSSGMVFDMVEPERIEVLRGPQGTLFGRNTIGGAINIVTKKPLGEFAFKQQLTYGARDRRRIATTVDTPRWGGLAATLSFLHFERGGLVSSTHTDAEPGERESTGFRLALNWQPAESVSVDYSLDLSRRESNPNINQTSHVRPMVADPDGEFYGGAFYETLAGFSSSDRLGHFPVKNTGTPNETDMDGHTLTMEWEVFSNLLVKSISSYRERDSFEPTEFGTVPAPADGSLCASPNPGDYDFVTGTCFNPVPAGTLVSGFEATEIDQFQEQWSQELQFIGSALEERLHYIMGLYFFGEKSDEETPLSRLVFSAPLAASFVSPLLVPQNRGNSLLIQLPPAAYTTDNRAYAAYGDFTFTVLPRLDATLGLRYTIDEREATVTDTFGGQRMTLKDDNRWSKFTPALTVTYRWSDAISTYAKAVTGYRAGGYDVRALGAPEAFFTPFNEENVTSYEVGWKSDLLERSLRFNGALFYADYTDRQISSLEPGSEGVGSQTLNAGESVHSGIELEVTWLPTANLRLSASYAYLDVDIKEFLTERLNQETAMPVNPGTVEDISDTASNPFSPEQSGALAVEYRFPARQWGQLTLRADASYTDPITFDPQLFRFATSGAHALLNARATLADIPVGSEGSLRLALWGTNLTNEEVREFSFDLGILGFTQSTYLELASWGLDLVYEFNR